MLCSSRAPEMATPPMMPYCTSQKLSRNVRRKGSRSSSVEDIQSPPGWEKHVRNIQITYSTIQILTVDPPYLCHHSVIHHGSYGTDYHSCQGSLRDVVKHWHEECQGQQDDHTCRDAERTSTRTEFKTLGKNYILQTVQESIYPFSFTVEKQAVKLRLNYKVSLQLLFFKPEFILHLSNQM